MYQWCRGRKSHADHARMASKYFIWSYQPVQPGRSAEGECKAVV